MKGLTRLNVIINRYVNYVRLNRLPLETSYVSHFQFARQFHDKLVDGPSFQDFLAREQQKNYKNLGSEANDDAPYLDELDLNGQNQKVFFEVKGCQMNVNDTEVVWSILQKNGYQKTTTLYEADIVLIVTCSIRESAETKIWTMLKELKSLKSRLNKKHMKIGVLGCMAERLKNKLLEIDKSVDVVAGPDSYKDLPRLLALTRNDQKAVNVLLSLDETYADVMPVRLNENSVSAFVSIMRGCDNMCTYCIVPFTRGRERSRPINSILDEIKILSEQGVKEVTLLGQNVNSYRDMSSSSSTNTEFTKLASGFKTVYKPKKGGSRFDVLLDKVSQVDPEMRIRFTSPHPKDFPDEVLHLIRERKNICRSIHLPAQSGSTAVLERMRRGYTREAYLELVEHIRNILPNVYLTTDIITGFCGETEQDHEDTLDLLRRVQYNYVYQFPYSMREKTTAHRRLIDDVPKEIKTRRLMEIVKIFRETSEKLNEAQIGETQLVLVESNSKRSDEFLAGRNDGNTKVIIPSCNIATSFNSSYTKPIKPGDYVAVTINEANSQVLKGVPLYHTTLTDFDESRSCRHGEKGITPSDGRYLDLLNRKPSHNETWTPRRPVDYWTLCGLGV